MEISILKTARIKTPKAKFLSWCHAHKKTLSSFRIQAFWLASSSRLLIGSEFKEEIFGFAFLLIEMAFTFKRFDWLSRLSLGFWLVLNLEKKLIANIAVIRVPTFRKRPCWALTTSSSYVCLAQANHRTPSVVFSLGERVHRNNDYNLVITCYYIRIKSTSQSDKVKN